MRSDSWRMSSPELLHVVVAQARGRLVEQEQVGVADQRPGQGDPLLHRVRQAAREAAGVLDGAEGVEHEQRPVAQLLLVLVLVRQAEQRGQEAGLGGDAGPGHDVLEHRHVREQPHALQGARDAEPGQLVRLEAGEGLAAPAERALVGGDEAADDVEQGGLAGAVRADDAEHLVRLDAQRDGVQRRQAAEADRDPGGLEPAAGAGAGGAGAADRDGAGRCRARAGGRHAAVRTLRMVLLGGQGRGWRGAGHRHPTVTWPTRRQRPPPVVRL
jgi:hypothetical protein